MLSLRKSTEDRIAAAQAALVTIEQRIARLEAERAAILIESDGDVGAIDEQLLSERRSAQALRDRLVALEGRRCEEAEQARQRAYETGIAAIERLLPRREAAAKAVEEAIVALSAAVGKYAAVTETITRDWPADVPRPGSNHGGYFSGHYVGLQRLGERIRDCFSSPALVYRTTGTSPPSADFVRRASDVSGRVEGFAESERVNSTALLEELRQRGAPRPTAVDDVEEVAA
jgi:hypothetical protein